MAITPAFINTPRIGIAEVDTAQTARASGTTSNVVDVLSAGTNGTRILEVVVKATDDPADCTVVLWIHTGTTAYVFDEIDLGNPAAGSATTPTARSTVTYSNLVLPNGYKLQASVTATTTAGKIGVFALGGNL